MADKKGVIIYYKYQALLALLPREDRGDILMASLAYDETGAIAEFSNPAAAMLFAAMRMDFDALMVGYEKKINAQHDNGSKGGRPKQEPKETQITHGLSDKPNQSQITHNDNDKDNEKEKEEEGAGAPVPFSLSDELNPARKNATTRIEAARHVWNEAGAKPEKRSIITNGAALLPTFSAYSDDEIAAAIRQYVAILADPKCKPFPVYSSFEGFMTSGVEKYGPDARDRMTVKPRVSEFEKAGPLDDRPDAWTREDAERMREAVEDRGETIADPFAEWREKNKDNPLARIGAAAG